MGIIVRIAVGLAAGLRATMLLPARWEIQEGSP
jgi:hypothetical protein